MINSFTYCNNNHLEAQYQQTSRAGVGPTLLLFAGINISFVDKHDSVNLLISERNLQTHRIHNLYI